MVEIQPDLHWRYTEICKDADATEPPLLPLTSYLLLAISSRMLGLQLEAKSNRYLSVLSN